MTTLTRNDKKYPAKHAQLDPCEHPVIFSISKKPAVEGQLPPILCKMLAL
jgi:hypothetical protein